MGEKILWNVIFLEKAHTGYITCISGAWRNFLRECNDTLLQLLQLHLNIANPLHNTSLLLALEYDTSILYVLQLVVREKTYKSSLVRLAYPSSFLHPLDRVCSTLIILTPMVSPAFPTNL